MSPSLRSRFTPPYPPRALGLPGYAFACAAFRYNGRRPNAWPAPIRAEIRRRVRPRVGRQPTKTRSEGTRTVATFGVKLIQRLPYKGNPLEEISNEWWFNGSEPGNAADWTALAEAVWHIYSRLMRSTSPIRLVHGYGYGSGSAVNVWSGDFTAGGTTEGLPPGSPNLVVGPNDPCPPQIALLIRGRCGQSTKGRPVYSCKYVHGVPELAGGGGAIVVYNGSDVDILAPLLDGTLPGGAVWASPKGAVVTTAVIRPFLTTHQIKRRGKRPRRGA